MSTIISPSERIDEAAFVGRVVTLPSTAGRLRFGIVDPEAPGVAQGISRLLFRSIQDAREENDGHLPSWLVSDIERNYISPEKVRTLWAAQGHRFALVLEGNIVGTVHVARDHDNIFTIDRERINVSARAHPGFKPERFHHVVNLSVEHALRRLRLGTAMIDALVTHFRGAFEGDGLWVRADPPWHVGLVGLGFVHDPSMDVFLPPHVARTAGLTHADFNRRHACDCAPPSPNKPEALAARPVLLADHKLQYVSFTRAFDATAPSRVRTIRGAVGLSEDAAALAPLARDWGLVAHVAPRAVAYPTSAEDVASLLAFASNRGRKVVVRGAGRSAAGQALGDDIILSTERLAGVSLDGTRATICGGTPWTTVLDALGLADRCPPVITGFLSTTVGGTLAAGGYSKGSVTSGLVGDHVRELLVATGDGRLIECSQTQASWLFDAVIGGLGQFGVIVRATLDTCLRPRALRVRRARTRRAELAHVLAAQAESDAFHVTSFATSTDTFSVVVARNAAGSEGDADGGDDEQVPFDAYVRPARPAQPLTPAMWLHLFAPMEALSEVLDAVVPSLRFDQGDALQVLPVRKRRPLRSLVRDGDDAADVRCAVCITRALGSRSPTVLAAENEELLDAARALGAKNQHAGTLPRTPGAWRASLGSTAYDALVRTKRMADPNDVLIAPTLSWLERR